MPSQHQNSTGATLTSPGNTTPKGYQQITALGSAAALTVPAGAKIALIGIENQPVRLRDDGTNPTASVGFKIAVGDSLQYTGDLSNVKLIETTTSATVNVLYYG